MNITDNPLSNKDKHRLQVHQKLDAILKALGHKIMSCAHCDDGIRTCGLTSEPQTVRCYHCNGSTIVIERNPQW